MRMIPIHFIVLLVLPALYAKTASTRTEVTSKTSQTEEVFKTAVLEKTPAQQVSGPKLSSQSLKESVVLVDFWASWCSPCIKALPYYNELYKKWKPKGLVVMAINLDDNTKERDQFLKTTLLDFPIFADGNPKYFDLFDVQVVPTLFVLDKNKRIIKMIRGFSENDKKEIEKALKELLI